MTNIILTVLAALTLLTVLFRYAMRPLFRDAIYERLNDREKKVVKLAQSKGLAEDNFEYNFLRNQFRVKNNLNDVSISDFLHFVAANRKSFPRGMNLEVKRFLDNADDDFKSHYQEFFKDLGLWMVLNSPIYAAIGIMTLVSAILLRNMDEKLVKMSACVFVDAESKLCRP